jgi:hypothetical protein
MKFKQAVKQMATGEKSETAIQAIFDAVEPKCKTSTDGDNGKTTTLWDWYNVSYYTLSDCKNSVDVLANSATEAEIIARRKDECFDRLISCAYLPYKLVEDV